MQLSSEDALRLNVLMANKPLAIRINESRMVLYALLADSETEIQLHPTGKETPYLKAVREMLSSHVLGSPGGYSVFLQRWTRMGQARQESIQQLLLLGEQEAVIAAAFSSGLTDELARRIWWAMDDPENARQILKNKAVVEGETGKILAQYLIEFLPFETEPEVMFENIRLILQPNLISIEEQHRLWHKSQRKTAYLVGFLMAIPHNLPMEVEAHALYPKVKALAETTGDPILVLLCQVYSSQGQAFIKTLQLTLKKPANQDILMAILKVMADYFASMRTQDPEDQTLEDIQALAKKQLYIEAIQQDKEIQKAVDAMFILARMNYGVLRPVLLTSTAIGSLMRKKVAPVMDVILEYITSFE